MDTQHHIGFKIVKEALISAMEKSMEKYPQYADHYRQPDLKLAVVTIPICFKGGDIVEGEFVLVRLAQFPIDLKPALEIYHLTDFWDKGELRADCGVAPAFEKIMILER